MSTVKRYAFPGHAPRGTDSSRGQLDAWGHASNFFEIVRSSSAEMHVRKLDRSDPERRGASTWAVSQRSGWRQVRAELLRVNRTLVAKSFTRAMNGNGGRKCRSCLIHSLTRGEPGWQDVVAIGRSSSSSIDIPWRTA